MIKELMRENLLLLRKALRNGLGLFRMLLLSLKRLISTAKVKFYSTNSATGQHKETSTLILMMMTLHTTQLKMTKTTSQKSKK